MALKISIYGTVAIILAISVPQYQDGRLRSQESDFQHAPSITASGTPNIQISLLKDEHRVTGITLTLMHTLLFNGEDYISTIYIPELKPYVSFVDSGAIKFRDIKGNMHFLNLNTLQRSHSKIWRGYYSGKDKRLLIFNLTDATIYEFLGSKIEVIKSPKYALHYQYEGNRLRKIYTSQNCRQDSVELEYADDDRVKYLNFSNTSILVEYTKNGSIRSCTWPISYGLTYTFSYNRNLLAAVEKNGIQIEKYRWANPEWRDWWKAPAPLPPFISFDRYYSYTAKCQKGEELFSYYKEGRKCGTWIHKTVNRL